MIILNIAIQNEMKFLLNAQSLKQHESKKIKIGGADDERMRLYVPKKSWWGTQCILHYFFS